jgi:phosphomannomutase
MDGRGQYVNPHIILALALRYLAETRGWQGKVIKTVSTTQMINRLGKEYGLEVIETPVGFNHIADWMLREEVLIGGEESGGMSFRGHIPEGDGVLMGLLLVEMVAATATPLDELVSDLMDRVGPVHYKRLDLRLSRPIPKDRMVQNLTAAAPDSISGIKLVETNTLDGVKYVLEDDSWLLIRPSGTEPVLRVYAEAPTPKMVDALLEHGRSIAEGEN